MFKLENILRQNIKELKPYSSARSEFNGQATIWLDANENPNESGVNRYPDPNQLELKKLVSDLKGLPVEQIFIGNGSDEAIDLLFRAFCEPGIDKAYCFPPTYGMYEVSAKINNVALESIPCLENFELPSIERINSVTTSKGLVFICSPNNPTGTQHPLEKIKKICRSFSGIVIVDEAYIDFAKGQSATSLLQTEPNLIVLQTLSKAFGLAGLRLGMAFSSPAVTSVLNNIKPPYNINTLSQKEGIKALKNISTTTSQIELIIKERTTLTTLLKNLDVVDKVFPSQANFILVKFHDAEKVYNFLKSNGTIVRNRSNQIRETLRITVGTPMENKKLIKLLKELE